MPELPEVEMVVRGLREPLVGRTITSMWHDWDNTLRGMPPTDFAARIAGQKIESITRRAKYIVMLLRDDILMVHLKMTGRLYVADAAAIHEADKWVHVKFGLDNGQELRFSDSRKFGRVYLTTSVEAVTGDLGPEPLEDVFTETVFRERLTGRGKVIKGLLLDQTFVAGTGNIYADEALHRAKIHPLRKSDTLTETEIAALYTSLRAALAAGINYEGASINWYRKPDGSEGKSQEHFFVYGRAGEPCHTCGALIEKIRVAQRGTHFCPVCQS
jgi:formamidopyrimidine-DNA glycosylase